MSQSTVIPFCVRASFRPRNSLCWGFWSALVGVYTFWSTTWTRLQVLVWRYDARLYFVNAEHFSDTFLAHLGKHQPSFVVLCADGMNDIDGSGLQVSVRTLEGAGGRAGLLMYHVFLRRVCMSSHYRQRSIAQGEHPCGLCPRA